MDMFRICRTKRMDDIVEILAREPLLSIQEIGDRMGLKRTPYLREMMIELVGQERVVYDWRDGSGYRTMVFRVFHHDENAAPAELYDENEDYLPYIQEEEEEERDARRRAQAESGFPYVTIDGEIDDLPFPGG